MNISRRTWDVAPLLVTAVGLGLLGLAIVTASVPDPSAGDPGNRLGAVGGLVMSAAGFLLLIAALARWTWRTRRRTAPLGRRGVTLSA